MKLLLTIFVFAFFVFPAIAQENTDQATVRCYYLFSQKKNKSDQEYFFRDTLTLDIGSQMSRYYDERKLQRDSTFRSAFFKLDPNRITSLTVIKNVDSDWLDRSGSAGDIHRNNTYDGISEQIFKNRNTGNIIMINTAGDIGFDWYKGIDELSTFNWAIEPDTAEIFNYSCQKASLRFRGRNYEAWFAPQIPINDGPWKFFGLPGLILKIKDTDNQFDFECIGIEYLNTPYPITIPENKYFECNWKDYNKVISRKGSGQFISINGGTVLLANTSSGPTFQLMELE